MRCELTVLDPDPAGQSLTPDKRSVLNTARADQVDDRLFADPADSSAVFFIKPETLFFCG
jgi:hypothetical protein